MTRLPTLAAILCIAIVVGTASATTSVPSSVAPSAAVASESVSASMAKTTSIAPSSSVAPGPKPTPTPEPPTPTPEPDPTDKTYILKDENNTDAVCLHMKAGLSLEFEYSIENNKTAKVGVDLKNSTAEVHPDSHCSKARLMAVLKLKYTPQHMEPYFVTFHFNGTSSKSESAWNASTISIEFTFNTDNFPDYNGDLKNSSVESTSPGPLFDGGKVGLNSSFACDVNRTITSFSPFNKSKSLNVSLFVADFKVQAFDFLNSTSGEFDPSVLCAEANTGNKIVPIAVGAALAGLVIVVLVAYLIGRLRNRKKSSYEALS